MTLQELKKEHQKRFDNILSSNQVFFAFGEKQWLEAKEKYNISDDNKAVSIGSGGYLPKKNVDAFSKDLKELNTWYKEQEKNLNDKIRMKKVSAEHYDEMLCVLPPAFWNGTTFQVGEPYDHVVLNGKELPVYATYTKKDGKHYSLGNLTTPQVKHYLATGSKKLYMGN